MKLKLILILFSCLISKIYSACEQSYKSLRVPIIEVFNSRGLRVSINNAVGLQEFEFHYKINEPFNGNTVNEKSGLVTQPKYGRWTYTDTNIQLRLEDKIYYWVSIKLNDTLRNFPKSMKTITTMSMRKFNERKISLDIFDNSFIEEFKEVHKENDEDDMNGLETTPDPNTYYCLCPEKINSFIDNSFVDITYEYKVDSLYDTVMYVLKNKTEPPVVYINGSYITDAHDLENWFANMLNLYDLTERYWLQEKEKTSCGHLVKLMSLVDKKRLLIRSYRDQRNKGVFEVYEPNTRKCIPYSLKRIEYD